MRKKGSHKTKFDVLVVGELNVDIILNGMNTLPSIGSEILANEMTVTLGSSSAIFASNISTLGVRTAFLGKIGEDDFGEAVLDSLQNKQIDTLWETISREIENAVRENSINLKQLVCLNWIDTANDIPETSFPEITRYIFESEPITHEGKIFHVSFIRAVKLFPVFKAITHEKGRLIYCAEKISPFIITFLIAATIMFSFGAFSLRSKTKSLEKNIVSIEKRMQILNRSVSFQIKDNNPLPTLEFIDSIFSSSNLPSYKDIVNDISMGTSPAFTMEQLQARYLDRQVKISLKGVIHADFDKAYKGYQNLLSSLLTNGYEIEHNIFMTQIHSSRFELELLWRIR
jgi:hypothetical protein